MNKKILIVEDDKLISEAYGDHLNSESYEIEYAYDGQEALDKVKEFKPHLILLDIIIPKITGISVLKKLKKDSKTKNIPVIVLTNLETNQGILKVIEAGGSHYFIKANYSLEKLSEQIDLLIKQTYGGK